MFTVFDQNYAASAAASLTTADCGELESMLMSWLYLWAGSLAEDNTDDDFMMYSFNIDDASGTPTSDTGDSLVYVSMDQGDDLGWAYVTVQMAVDGGPFATCTNPNQAVGSSCALSDNGDEKWAFGEEITISEGTDDLCDAATNGSCEVVVKVIDRSTNKLLYESTSVTVV